MSSPDSVASAISDILKPELDQVAAIKDEICSVYDRFDTDISGTSIAPAFESLPADIRASIDTDKMAETIRVGLKSKMRQEIEILWQECGIERRLAVLLGLKKGYAADTSKKMWRPTGKSAAEQLASLRLEILQEEYNRLDTCIQAEQMPEIHRLVAIVEEKREKLRQYTAQRKSCMAVVAQRHNATEEGIRQLTELNKKLIYQQMDRSV